MSDFDHKKIEEKWRNKWAESKINQKDMDTVEKPFTNLMMFPYPSAEGLHIGSVYTFSGVDTFGRFQQMKGNDVFEPIGLDGFGIHSENYAIKIGEHIGDVSKRTEKHFYEQLDNTGNMFDWTRTVETYKPEYYKWTQWLFIQFFKKGLAYRKKSLVNWCPGCKTVLSDEQVIDGKCERSGDEVTQKDLDQWFFKITDYSERLLNNLEWIDWDNDVKIGQKNWIGKSVGAEIIWKLRNPESNEDFKINTFTTRFDTIPGPTFLVVAPEYQDIDKLVTSDNKNQVDEYIKESTNKSDLERQVGKDKTGVFTGSYAINPYNNDEVPIYVADYVIAGYGTGAVMGMPGHDQRDHEFAVKFDLPIKYTLKPKDEELSEGEAYEGEGYEINSGEFDGLWWADARDKILEKLVNEGSAIKKTNYKLRDWCVSRQRYWGPPIPMIHCDHCESKGDGYHKHMPGWWTDENLPVLLPQIPEFERILPDGSGKGPLEKVDEFVHTTCPNCGSDARRETDVSDPFVDSSWYFLRYPFTENEKVPFGGNFLDNPKSFFKPDITKEEEDSLKLRMKKWFPVSWYIGGKEHTVLHLLYARFITMALKDMDYIDFEEPFTKFYGHGLITKDGAKMSKSKGNVINPDEYFEEFGADSVRLYLRFIGSFDQGGDWRDTGMKGMRKFINKLWDIFDQFASQHIVYGSGVDNMSKLHKTIKNVGEDLDSLKFNTAVAKIMELVNWYKENEGHFDKKQVLEILKSLVLMLAPMMPHFAEEIWESIHKTEDPNWLWTNSNSVHLQKWPEFDESQLIETQINIVIQVNGKVRGKIEIPNGASQEEVIERIKLNEVYDRYELKNSFKEIYIPNKLINFIVK